VPIHPTALISEESTVSPEADIGPYCVIAGAVEIGAHTVIESHVRIGSRYGRVVIGQHNYIQSATVLGGPPQDHSFDEGYTELVIGDHNRIGEYVTMHLGTVKGGGVTRVGNGNLIMSYAHLGHDCQLADHIVMTNGAQLSGHTSVEERAVLSGMSATSQFVRLGAWSFLAGGAHANKDILPYTIAEGRWATVRATNRVGLKRGGFEPSERRNIDRAVRLLLDRSLTVARAAERIREECAPSPQIEHLLEFVSASERGIARGG
jgi:UDP-N-acetylglucosamine acyltransferase